MIERLKGTEPAMRARGVGSLYLFGSYARGEATSESDLDVFVDAGDESFYDLSNFMGVYEALRGVFPGVEISYSTRAGLSKYVREQIEQEAVRVF